MTQYKFNIKTGHYVAVLNEDEQLFAPEVEEKDEEKEAEVERAHLKNLNTEDIVQMKQDKQAKLLNIQKEIDQKKDNIIQIQDKIAQLEANETTQQSSLNNLQKQLLQAQLDYENKKFDKAKIANDEMKKILAAQKALIESAEMQRQLPEKYKYLTESNIQAAKIHVDKLIKDDVQQRIQGMIDFKKAFSKSNLLYGKDKEGFYAVCIDQQDFNKLTSTLEEVGYLRDEILSCCLPQIFDRSEMVK